MISDLKEMYLWMLHVRVCHMGLWTLSLYTATVASLPLPVVDGGTVRMGFPPPIFNFNVFT